MKCRVSLVFAASALVFGLAPIPGNPVLAQGQGQQSVAERCFEFHRFGAQPVDVAKTIDGETVLAQVRWGYHDAIGCYLTLDDEALAVLRAAPPPRELPGDPTDDSKRCFTHHKFGESPVDVAKTADRGTVLARLSWGFHDSIGCYLVLDDTALSTLRVAVEPKPTPDPTPDPTPEPEPPTEYVAVAAASKHTCAITTDRTIECWGDSAGGKLDAPSGAFTDISAGWWHTCALAVDQTISCWGDDDYGQLGAPSGRYTSISAGKLHSCAISTDQTIACWGYNIATGDGQVDVPDGKYTAVSAGRSHSCAITADQAIVCWGDPCATSSDWPINCWGDSTTPPEGRFTAIAVGGSSSRSTAYGHSCAIKVDQTITCWGNNDYGQLREPAGKYIAIAAGDAHTCAIDTDNAVACWGRTLEGHTCTFRLDSDNCWDRHFSGRSDPPPGQYIAVAAGHTHSCAIRADRTMACWGDNRYGQSQARPSPAELPPSGRYTAIDTGRYHACAIDTDEAVVCWGRNDYGQSDPPSGSYTAIATGGVHSCAIREDQTIACWGYNRDERTALRSDPPAGQFTAIAAGGGGHSCAIRVDQSIACWGDDSYSQTTPPAGRYTAIAAGERHSCAIKDDQTITCWGGISGAHAQVPAGRYTAIAAGEWHSCGIRTDQTIACWGLYSGVQTDAPAGQYTAITAAHDHSCAIKTDQTIACWGINSGGQTDAPAGEYNAVSADRLYSCAIKPDGSIACWGDNSWVLRERATTSATTTPTTIAAGSDHSCAIKPDQTIACWGLNDYGQSDAPPGRYTAIAASRDHSCAIVAKTKIGALVLDSNISNIVCWGDNPDIQTTAPAGRFTAVTTSRYSTCGVTTDQSIVCWGNNPAIQANAPTGRFTAIDFSTYHWCAVKTDQTIACSDGGSFSSADVPAGRYTAIAAGDAHFCAIGTDQTIACWGRNQYGQLDAPSGQYTAIAAGVVHSCAIKTDGSIACWGNHSSGRTDAPGGRFTSISAGDYHSCATGADGAVACWGDNRFGQSDPFSAPNTSDGHYFSADVGTDSWWHEPRGLLRVKFHVCTTSELRPYIPADFIDEHVDALNKEVAPFYRWQSSGLLSVQFEAGRVLEEPYEPAIDAGEYCVEQVDEGPSEGGLAHQFYVYGTAGANHDDAPAGLAMRGGPLSWIFHPHPRNEAPQAPSGRELPWVLFVAGHELDHNIGVPHFYGARVGPTRGSAEEGSSRTLGVTSDNSAFSRVYSCFSRRNLGWPTGDDHPACVLVPELPGVRNTGIVEVEDGAAVVVWQEPIQLENPVPIHGYEIRIQRDNGSMWELVERHEVSSSTRTFPLPKQLSPGSYFVTVQGLTNVGGAPGSRVEFTIFGDEYDIRVRAIPASQELYPQSATAEFPIEYELTWDPVPNARRYEIFRPRDCPSPGVNEFCVSTEPRIVFSESRGELVEGEGYSLTIYARITDTFRVPVGVADFTAYRNIPEWWKGRDNTPPF